VMPINNHRKATKSCCTSRMHCHSSVSCARTLRFLIVKTPSLFLFAPGFRPPSWSWYECVHELPFGGIDVSVATRPSFLTGIAGTKLTDLAWDEVDQAMLVKFPCGTRLTTLNWRGKLGTKLTELARDEVDRGAWDEVDQADEVDHS
jgi:hypothetical protein